MDCDIKVQKQKRKLQQEADQKVVEYWACCSKCEVESVINADKAKQKEDERKVIEQFAGCNVA